jgi:hypothetical protein
MKTTLCLTRRTCSLLVLPVLVMMLVAATRVATADDLFPPTWRGLPGSTWAVWDYLTPNPNPLPDMGFNPYGTPQTQIYPGVGQVWWQQLDGRFGVWPLSGEIWVDIPNRPEPQPWKEIQIQLTWEPQAPGNTPFVLTTVPEQVNGMLVQQIPLDGLWMHSIYTIHLEPNPLWERILITGGINVDQLVIDTICVPEPGALSLLLVGLLALRRTR